VELPAVKPVTVTEQLSGDPDRLQAEVEKETLPVPPVCDQVIVSPVMEPVCPVTVVVHVAEEPTSTVVEGEQLTAAVVVAGETCPYSTTRLFPYSAIQRSPAESKATLSA
jgi:hypothetical protein